MAELKERAKCFGSYLESDPTCNDPVKGLCAAAKTGDCPKATKLTGGIAFSGMSVEQRLKVEEAMMAPAQSTRSREQVQSVPNPVSKPIDTTFASLDDELAAQLGGLANDDKPVMAEQPIPEKAQIPSPTQTLEVPAKAKRGRRSKAEMEAAGNTTVSAPEPQKAAAEQLPIDFKEVASPQVDDSLVMSVSSNPVEDTLVIERKLPVDSVTLVQCITAMLHELKDVLSLAQTIITVPDAKAENNTDTAIPKQVAEEGKKRRGPKPGAKRGRKAGKGK